jgi:hypothetical protein
LARFDWSILEGTVAVLAATVDRMNVVIGEMTAVMKAFASSLPGGKGGAATGTPPPAGGKEAEEAGGKLASLSFGINQAIGAFQGVVGIVQSFLGALDPALMEQLNWAVRNVVAAIAVALRPVALVLVDVFRQLAGVILPLAQALAPLLGELAGIIAEAIIPLVDVFAELLTALMPLVTAIMPLVRVFTTIIVWIAKLISIVINLFVALYEMLGLFDLIAGIFKVLEDVVKGVIRALALMIGTIAKFFGGEAFVRAMAAKFKQRADEKGTPAVASAQNFSMSSVQDLLRAQQISAAKAVGGQVAGPQKTTENFLAEIGKELEGIANNGETFMGLMEKILQAVKDLLPSKQAVRAALPGADDPEKKTFAGGFWNGVTFGMLDDDGGVLGAGLSRR